MKKTKHHSRLFVIDPVCAMEFGHSLNALAYFSNVAAPFADEVIAAAATPLPSNGTVSVPLYRSFGFYYDRFIDIDRPKKFANRDHIAILREAHTDFARFLFENDISSADTLLFPSIDFYSLIGLSLALKDLPKLKKPTLMIRFIGVMENATEIPNPDNAYVDALNDLLSQGVNCSICAETPKLTRWLRRRLDCDVICVAYPSASADDLPASTQDRFTLYCGGSARPDKGFFRLLDIFNGINDELGSTEISFIVQNLPDKEVLQHADYINRLQAIPNVQLQEGKIPYRTIVEGFRKCDIVLLPYDAATYRFRGSAMLMEAMMFGRYALCESGTAFSEQAILYDGGTSCSDIDSYIAATAGLKSIGRSALSKRAKNAATMYQNDVQGAMKNWFECK